MYNPSDVPGGCAAGYRGTGGPVVLAVSRKAELCGFFGMKGLFNKYRAVLLYVLLVVVTLGIFWPITNHDFLKYDDDTYLTNNRNVQSGLSLENIKWAFVTSHASNWHPLTWLSHMLDCELFGLNASMHHLVNLIFHVVNTLLLLLVVKQITGSEAKSIFVAALFALHPLHIESVAWAAERKDVLSTFFGLLALLAYLRHVRQAKKKMYFLALIFLALGLLAKPMLVTMPFVFLLLDYWPLERISFSRSSFRLLAEKIPFFVLVVVSSVITFIVQRAGGAISTMETFSIKTRASNAVVSYAIYIVKMLWPKGLAVLYPHPGNNLPVAKVIVCTIVVVLLSVYFIYVFRRCKYLAFGWLWYLGTLIPVIGLVQVGSQATADRYTYFPLTGLFIIIAMIADDLTMSLRYRKIILSISGAVVIAALMVSTSIQLRYWKNSETLFARTLDVTKGNYFIHNNYGNILTESKKFEEAIEQFNASLILRPNIPQIHNNIGNALHKMKRLDEAIRHYEKALSLKEDFAIAHYNMAVVLSKKELSDKAIAHYRKAVKLDSSNVDAFNNLGFELAKQGKFEEAVEYYNKAIELNPNFTFAHGGLGLALARLGKIDEAIEQFRIVLKDRPNDVEMRRNLGILLESQKKNIEAIQSYRRANKR